ncbi:MAG: hypothetical protein FWE38_03235, partial [Firmicutes bacterium]|nr:hypothetical protein [Bacillota bacterium]
METRENNWGTQSIARGDLNAPQPKVIRPVTEKSDSPPRKKSRGPYKPRTPKVKTWSLVMVGVFVLSVLATSIVWAMSSSNRDNDVAAAVNISLFNANGTLNPTQSQNILNTLNAARNGVTNRTAEFRLFPDVGAGQVLATSRLNFRVAHVNGDRVTLWASTASHNQVFNTNTGTMSGIAGNVYWNAARSSSLRDNVITNWNGIAAGIPGINDHTHTQAVTTYNANQNDRLWIPSEAEVRDGGTWGL